MKRQERANYIHQELNRLFPDPPIPLNHSDTYTLLIAVLLSAQCTDARVNQVTHNLFSRAQTPKDMVKLSVEEIEDIVRPCGLAPRKAKAIHRLSEILITQHKGNVPNDLKVLETLPGVGHKTASVVMAQAFNVPAFPVDTHIHRLAQRWGLTQGKNVRQTEEDLKKVFPKEDWNRLHLQIIYYGRNICPARQCDGLKCGLCQTLFPNRKKVKKINKP